MNLEDTYVQLIQSGRRNEIPLDVQKRLANHVVITTESGPFHDLIVLDRYDFVAATVVYGSYFLRDFFASVRDIFGGRTRSSESLLDSAIAVAILEVKLKAWRLGATMVVGCDTDISEIASKGKSGFSVTIAGTPLVTRKLTEDEQHQVLGRRS